MENYVENEINSFEQLDIVCNLFMKLIKVETNEMYFPYFVKFIQDEKMKVNLPQWEWYDYAMMKFINS